MLLHPHYKDWSYSSFIQLVDGRNKTGLKGYALGIYLFGVITGTVLRRADILAFFESITSYKLHRLLYCRQPCGDKAKFT